MVGGLVNDAFKLAQARVRERLAKIKGSTEEAEFNTTMRRRLNELYSKGLADLDKPEFDFNTHLGQYTAGANAALDVQERAGKIGVQQATDYLTPRGEALRQNMGYRIGLDDAATRNQIGKMGARAEIADRLVRLQQGHEMAMKGGSDLDETKLALDYITGENEKNRQLASAQGNRNFWGQMIGLGLLGAGMLFGKG